MEYERMPRPGARSTWQVVVLALLLSGNLAQSQTPVEIPQPDVLAHQLSRVNETAISSSTECIPSKASGAGIFHMRRRKACWTLPTYVTSISIGGRYMSVADYGGWQVGMPAALRDVEEATDEAAGTREWLKPSQ
jgi:hypothetical protein